MSQKHSLQTLKTPSSNDFFVLDIDSTLVTTHQRNQVILQAWLKEQGKMFPDDRAQLQKAQCQFGDYGFKQALERINFEERNLGSRQNLQDYWRQHFFSNRYLSADAAVRGAVHWVQDLEEKSIDFVYLTARHKNTMWEGTLSSLDQMGFPISEEILFLKEDLQQSDAEYKSATMAQILQRAGERQVRFIDNEPVVLNQIKKDFPQVEVIWFESTHSERELPSADILRIQDFHFADLR